ncbi:MAG: uroporphyrinogen decarboxylase family protein [Spirochaetota bacterium]
MKQDVLDALSGRSPKKIPSKETLNHPAIIKHVTGIDPFDNTPEAFALAWEKLGIDIHVAKPEKNAPRPKVPGGTWEENGTTYSDYGVYPTAMEHSKNTSLDFDWVFDHDTAKDDFNLAKRIELQRERSGKFARDFGDKAVMYDLYYTTLFMWPVMKFDWQPFMMAAMAEPDRFDKLFERWAIISRKRFEAFAAADDKVVFCHDDLSTGTGPVFPPTFYEKHIFSRYQQIMEPAVKAGKKIVFVSDGNIDIFLERLLDMPIAGIMFENPATPFQRVLDTWGKAKRGFIGGISTELLTNGTPAQVADHTKEVIEQGRQHPGFIISSCGGLPGNIPLENIIAYFETRSTMGCPSQLP